MNRRGFLSKILKGTVGAAAVVVAGGELWTPGKVTHFLPPASGWKLPFAITPAMKKAITEPLKGLFSKENLAQAEYWYRDLAFASGDQWTGLECAERAAAGRPTLTINRIPSLASHAAHAVAKTDTERNFIYERIASDRGLHDLQRLYNYQASALAEATSLAPRRPFFVKDGRKVILPAPQPQPIEDGMRWTGLEMVKRVREIVEVPGGLLMHETISLEEFRRRYHSNLD